MPELPEVETIRRGIAPYLIGQTVTQVIVREHRLRWPVSSELEVDLSGQEIRALERRGKYLLLRTTSGSVLLHMGMSGSLRILPVDSPANKHDHIDILLASGRCLRLTDPRRFGALLWTTGLPDNHPLLNHLGPEPLAEDFHAAYLHELAQGRKRAIKDFIMDSRIVVGIGNIYANEALFRAGINPRLAAGRISLDRYLRLVTAIRELLAEAIVQGGTTLRDFANGKGKPGYFQHRLQVYAQARLPCPTCAEPIRLFRLNQRATYYCPRCQR